MKWQLIEPQFGDIIRVKSGSIYHYGIFVTDVEVIQFGLNPKLIRDMSPEQIVVCTSNMDDFICGEFLEVGVPEGKERRKRNSPTKTVELARQQLGEGGYHILHNNCEHFAYFCMMGVKYSSQTEKFK